MKKFAAAIAIACALLSAAQAAAECVACLPMKPQATGQEVVPCELPSSALLPGQSALTYACPIGAPVINPMAPAYRCVGDGVADDSACIQSAITAASGGVVDLSGHLYKIVTPPTWPAKGVTIRCASQGHPNGNTCGFVAGATNLNLLHEPPDGSRFQNLYINMAAAGANTSGAAITTGPTSNSITIDGVYIEGPCNGVQLNGANPDLLNSYISNPAGTNCYGVTIGNLTTGSNTVDAVVDNVNIFGSTTNPPSANFLVNDAGGLIVNNSDFGFGTTGTIFQAGHAQAIIWAFIMNTALADNPVSGGVYINTTDSTSVIAGLEFTGDWSASTQADGVNISNTGGGVVTGIHFNGQRNIAELVNGFTINAGVSDVDIEASSVCGVDGVGVQLASGVSNINIRNNRMGPACNNIAGYTGTIGVNLLGSNANVSILGNDFVGFSSPVAGSPTGHSTVANNKAQDGIVVGVASASSISLTSSVPLYDITGTTGISTINGTWDNREVLLRTTQGAITFSTGGNICNGLTSVQNVPVLARYNANSACWMLK